MNVDWISQQLDYIHFAYGVFLTTLLLICLSLHTQEQDRPDQPSWLLLGLFGLTLGIYSWLEMAAFLGFTGSLSSRLGLLLLVLAHLLLVEFGRRATPRLGGPRAAWMLYGSLLLLALTGLPYGQSGLNASVRYFLVLPAWLLASWAFSQQFRRQPVGERAPFFLLSVAAAGFAFIAGSIVPESGFALARVLNNETFLRVTGFPVQIPRALLALAITLLLGWLAVKSTRLGRRSFFAISLALTMLTTIGGGWFLTEYEGRQAARDLESDNQSIVASLVTHVNDALQAADRTALNLADSPALVGALASGGKADLDQANALLDQHQRSMGLAVCYLLDGTGLTIASSNRAERGSFVGKSFAFRPYFTETVAGRQGRYFALGTTSGERGYYAGSSVLDRDLNVLGVVVAKSNVNFLEKSFAKHSLQFLVSPEGVIFMSGSKDYLFRTLWPATAAQRAALQASRQFGEISFTPLLEREPPGNSYLMRAGRLTYLVRMPISVPGWSAILIHETTGIAAARLLGIGTTFVGCMVLFFAFTILWSSENNLLTFRKLLALRERNEAVLNEQLLMQQFLAEVSRTLQGPDATSAVLQQETEIIVGHLGAAFARIWILNPATNLLELQASAGLYTNLNGAYASIPVGRGKVGQIAREGKPLFTNAVPGDPGVPEQEWARREGMQAFAGYPLRVEGRVIGVMGLFARQALNEFVGEALGLAATFIASYLDRKHAEEALRESENKYKSLIETTDTGYLILDAQGTVIDANKEYVRLTGYDSLEGIIGRSTAEWTAPYDLERNAAEIKKSMERGYTRNLEIDYVNRTGEITPVEINATVVGSGDAVKIISLCRDVTERKKAEEVLRESEKKFKSLLEDAPLAITVVNTAGEIEFINTKNVEIIGYTRDETPTLPIWWSLAYPDPEERKEITVSWGNIQHRILSGEDVGRTVRKITCKDGTRRDVELSFSRAGNKVVVIFNDVSERTKAEAALREKTQQLEELTKTLETKVAAEIAVRTRNEQMLVQQSKMAAMGEMLGAIAHQWRQPLNTLGLCVQNIGEVCAHGELDRPYIERTVRKSMGQIQHMSATIDDFRNFFLPDKERSRFDAMAAVGDVLTLLAAQLTSNGIGFRLTCRTHARSFEQLEDLEVCPEKTIDGFRNEFGHVILNLVINARDAITARREAAPDEAPGRGLITFDFYSRDGAVVIEVGDNGTGIPEAIFPRIFEPYFTSKDAAKGTGIGLYMSKIIIEEHLKGSLGARNGPEGAVFTITLRQAEGTVVS